MVDVTYKIARRLSQIYYKHIYINTKNKQFGKCSVIRVCINYLIYPYKNKHAVKS